MFPEPRSTFGYPLEITHVQAHGQCEGATYRLISHRKVTMRRKSRACCGWNVSDLPPPYGTWSALKYRDLCDLFRQVATHRSQVTMVFWRWWEG